MYKLLQTSGKGTGPSITAQAAVYGPLVVAAMYVINYLGVQISSDELDVLVQAVTAATAAIGALVSAVMAIYGIVRKAYNSFKK